MDNLQWFKFSQGNWMMGKIQRCPEVTQARFIRLCCLYWNKEANLSLEDAEIEIDKEHLDILIAKKVIKSDDQNIFIDFLDEQLVHVSETSKGKRDSGFIGNLKRWHPSIYDKFIEKKVTLKEAKELLKLSQADSTPITDPSQNIAEKRREEEIREDESVNTHEFSTQEYKDNLWDKFLEFTSRNKLDKEKVKYTVTNAYEHYRDLDWHNAQGKPVKNLFTSIKNNWFKDLNEFRLTEQNNGGDITRW